MPTGLFGFPIGPTAAETAEPPEPTAEGGARAGETLDRLYEEAAEDPTGLEAAESSVVAAEEDAMAVPRRRWEFTEDEASEDETAEDPMEDDAAEGP